MPNHLSYVIEVSRLATEQNRMENEIQNIIQLFKDGKSTVVLSGKSGTGKTWMARKVGLLAVKKEVFDFTIWICLSFKHDGLSLFEHVARQFSLLSSSMEKDNEDTEKVDDTVGKEETLELLKEKIRVRLSADGVRQRILVILDDEGSKMSEGDENLEQLFQFIQHNSTVANGDGQQKVKVLITTSHNEDLRHKTEGDNKIVIDMPLLNPDESISMLRQIAGVETFEVSGVETLVKNFIGKTGTGFTPGEITLLVKLLSYHQLHSGLQDLEHSLELASRVGLYTYTYSLCSRYEKIPDGVSVDISWSGSHLFRDCRSVHYSELISYWIMEGYLGPIYSLEKAYEKGHHILMQLMDCQVVKKVNDDFLQLANAMVDFADHHHTGYGGTAKLGLAYVLSDGCAWNGIGKVAERDNMIGTLGGYKNGQQLTTIFLDGNCLSREDPDSLLQSNQELQNLGLFGLRIPSLRHSLPHLKKLNVLVLRGCDYLENIDDVKELRMLTVLEVSGSCLLKSIPRDFFEQLTQLRSLHFSDFQIEELPESFYDLTELRWLILKGCSQLRELKSLKKCEKLMVVDLSGAASLVTLHDKSLKSFPKLTTLNLSETKIKCVPIFREARELTHLSFSGCCGMDRLPSIKTLTNLQVLDLSRSTIKEFKDKSLEFNTSLKILDLSGASILSESIPFNISNPREFYLKNCSVIKEVRCADSPKDLEILDFSGSCNLVKVEEEFFKSLENLGVLNLSETKIEVLPSLSALHNLHQLLLSCCLNLKKLPSLTSSKLEELDLSDCRSLISIEDNSFEHLSLLRRLIISKTKIERLPELRSLSNLEELNLSGVKSFSKADFLEHMSKLEYLDLSDTELKQLPSLSNLKDLNCLMLRGCQQLGTLPSLEELQKLEILDLSHTAISDLPSLGNSSNLRSLLLGACQHLKGFENSKVLDLSGNVIKELPCEISRFTQLEHLALPSMKNIQADGINNMTDSLDKRNAMDWSISSVAEMAPKTNSLIMSVSSSGFLKLLPSFSPIGETTSKQFHLCVHPVKEQKGTGVLMFHKDEFIFRDIYLLSRHYYSKAEGKLIELHRLLTFPNGIEDVLCHAEHLFLFDNLFIKSLADLGAENIKKMKGCWIEGCRNMEIVIKDDTVKATDLGIALEILWVSNALSLRSIYSESEGLQSGSFRQLERLYLDCCPMLARISFSSDSLQKLQILNVRFCENLENLFEDTEDEEHKLPNLLTLRLWELPKLLGIGCAMPSLQFLEVGECPLLEQVLSSSQVPHSLEVLKVRNCLKLDNLLQGLTPENCKMLHLCKLQLWGLPKLTNIGIEAPLLRTLEVGDCPLLKHVISSTHTPENLEVLKVRFCDKLETLFLGVVPENSRSQSLQTILLWHLPMLTSIGITFPSVQESIIWECSRLRI